MKLKLKLLIIIIITLTAYLLLSQHEVDKVDKVSSRIVVQQAYLPIQNAKTILYWTPISSQKDFNLGTGKAIFKKCAYSNCFATYDKGYLPIDKFDALVFHGVEYPKDPYDKPSKRNPKQRYIFFCLESPIYSNNYMKDSNNFYNWTMTYRMDSDLMRPYGMVEERKTNYRPPKIGKIRKRPKKIAWMVSNCKTQSERELLYHELSKFLPVDVYGTCGNLNCSRRKGEKCYKMLELNYKFYLAFEDSVCEDYVTEKLYSVLKRDIVPIVFGGANYTKIAPPNSVINVMDFKSIRELVHYIKYLDKHPEAYLRFFEWKRDYVITDSRQKTLCDLCKKLNEPIQTHIYGDIAKWWQGKDFDKKCRKVNLTRMISGPREIKEMVELLEAMEKYL